jgi:hypothetical protein
MMSSLSNAKAAHPDELKRTRSLQTVLAASSVEMTNVFSKPHVP